jgi:hypothetical protein
MQHAPTAVLADADPIARITLPMSIMYHTMPEIRSSHEAPAPGRAGRQPGICVGLLLGLMILTLVRTSEALAGDAAKPDLNPITVPVPLAASPLRIPVNYQALDLTADKAFPTQDFRPRGRSMLEQYSPAGGFTDMPLMSDTTAWQRLSEYRVHDRVRVLTLWETGGSSVSLQAGRKGNPSLQWTSRLMSRSGSAHGLLDELFARPFSTLTRSQRVASHSPSSEPAVKLEKILDGAPLP